MIAPGRNRTFLAIASDYESLPVSNWVRALEKGGIIGKVIIHIQPSHPKILTPKATEEHKIG